MYEKCDSAGSGGPPSFRSSPSPSGGSRFWNLVLDGAQRDIHTEIGYAEDKITVVRRHRQIELNPNFWSLDKEIVGILKNGSPEVIQDLIELKKRLIMGHKTQLSKANKMARYMHSNRAMFHTAVEGFSKLLPPDEDIEGDKIDKLVASVKSDLLELDQTMTKSVELEVKLSSLDDQINDLNVKMKEFALPNDEEDVQGRLEAVELQNCMLNELLSRIIQQAQETSKGMQTLESGEPHEVRLALREGLILSFGALADCFPNLNAPRTALSELFWVPHDAYVDACSLTRLLELFHPEQETETNVSRRLKFLKGSVKDVCETHAKVQEVKKKIWWRDQRKKTNLQGTVVWFSVPKLYEYRGRDSIASAIARDGRTPVHLYDSRHEDDGNRVISPDFIN